MSLSSILNNLAVESGAVMEDQEANPEELTIVTDSTLTELDDVIAEMAEDVEKAAQGNDAAEKMIDVIESLESKVIMLRSMRDRGDNLNEMSAHQYANSVVIALESRGFPAALYQKDIADLKVSFESHSRYDYSVEAEDKTVSLGAKIKGMFSRALDAFIQFWRSLVSRVKGLNKNLSELGNVLLRRAAKIENNATPKRKVKANGLYAIAKSKGEVDPVAAIDGVKDAGKKVTEVESKLTHALGDIAKGAIVGEGADAAEKASTLKVKTSIAMYGGYEIKMDETGNFKLSGEKVSTDAEVDALDATTIGVVGRKLIDLGVILTVSENDQKRMIATLEASIAAVVKSLGQKEASLSGRMLKEFNKGLSVIRSGRTVLNGFAAQVGKQAYRFASLSANAY